MRPDHLRSRGERGTRFTWPTWGPLLVVALAIGYLLYDLRACLVQVAYPNDSAMHEQMVRWALEQIRSGHMPFDGWYPWLNLGSPHFLHYQSLPHILTAVLALAIGVPAAFTWTLYLLLALWPISVYISARLLGLERWSAAAAAAVSPFVVSTPGVGYEIASYLWRGSGVWSQLWAMWTLPLAWGFSWQALTRGRRYFGAILFLGLTTAFHFESAYMALLPVPIFCLVSPKEALARLRRAVVIVAGWFLSVIFVLVPLISQQSYAARNEFAVNTFYYDSFGARKILAWLFTGKIFDSGRLLPVVSVFVAIGLATCAARFLKDERARALLLVFVASLVLFFGPTTLGPAVGWLPGSHDIFFRRYVAGVELSGMLLAGVGAAAVAGPFIREARRFFARAVELDLLRRFVLLALGILVLSPAFLGVSNYVAGNAQLVAAQQSNESTSDPAVNALIARAEAIGGGRIYAGLPTNWGNDYLVGQVPMYEYLTTRDANEVGFTLRTASLMSNPEAYFDEHYLGDYEMFGVRFLLMPEGKRPPISARLLETLEGNSLYEVGSPQTNGYLQVVDSYDYITENRTNVGYESQWMMSPYHGIMWAERGLYPTVAFDGAPPAPWTLTSLAAQHGAAGRVLSSHVDLFDGYASASVYAARTSVVLLKTSYDPGWAATIDGVPATPEIIGPALIGVVVQPGLHRVIFRFRPYQHYDLLFAVSGLTLLCAALGPVVATRFRRRRRLQAESG